MLAATTTMVLHLNAYTGTYTGTNTVKYYALSYTVGHTDETQTGISQVLQYLCLKPAALSIISL